jgi:hypothetical protein
LAKRAAIHLPFEVPAELEQELARVRDHWVGLRRGQADIPFADDVKLSALEGAGVDLMVIDAFERPSRFRIAIAGPGIARRYGQLVEGFFADEIARQAPLDYLVSQCSATVEARATTFYRNARPSYSRLMLPLWGDGHINAILCAVSFG